MGLTPSEHGSSAAAACLKSDAEIVEALVKAEHEHDTAKREFIAAQSREWIAYRRLQDAQRAWFKRFYDPTAPARGSKASDVSEPVNQ